MRGQGGMTTPDKWKWFGNVGHFIGGHDCKFHLCTQVGKYLVSTIGEYMPPYSQDPALKNMNKPFMSKEGWMQVGFNRFYETIVFKAGKVCNSDGCDCGYPAPKNWGELGMNGYQTAGEATRGHYQMCEEWSKK